MRFFFSLLSILAACLAIYLLGRDLPPPGSIRFAAGPEGGGYAGIAAQYRERLAPDGIAVEILHTRGSVENTELLATGAADVALLQGGILAPPGTEALAALFYEPLFIFTRADAGVSSNPGTWLGLDIATGGEGSGTRAAAEAFFRAAGQIPGQNRLDPRGGSAAADALIRGEVDVALFVAPLNASYLQPLFLNPELVLLPLDYVDALSRRIPQSRVVAFPPGGISLSPTVPARAIDLIVMVAHLDADADLHPAVVDRLVEAAREIHSGRDALTSENTFPTTERISGPVDAYARDLLRSGPSKLQEYLPYWITAQINRVLILALPIIILLIPLLRAIPGVYRWRMRARVWRHYSVIRDIDEEARNAGLEDLRALERKLEDLDIEISDLNLPLAYRDYAYTARLHIDLIRKRIQERCQAGQARG